MSSRSRDRQGATQLDQRLDARADYDAMFESRFARTRRGLAPSGGGADYHTRNEPRYLRLIEQARDMERNDSIIGKTIERAATNVVQDGLTLCPDTGDAGLDAAIYDRWQDWSTDREQCDVAGESCWHEMEQIAVHSMLRDGDIVGLGLADGPLQMIEGHQVRDPAAKGRKKNRNIILGVEVDDLHRRVRYHIRAESFDPQSTTQRMPSSAYDVRDSSGVRQVFHFYVPNRSSATRGVTALAPVFQIAGMFEDLNFAKLVQAQVVSCFALFRYREASAPGGDLPAGPSYGAQETVSQSDGSNRLVDDLAPGVEVTGAPGEKLEGFSPDVPNTSYFEHAKLLLSMIAVNLGMPYSMLMLDSGGNSWSSVRVDYDESRRGFRRIQHSLIERWHSPIYRWKLRHFAAEDPSIGRMLDLTSRRAFKHQWRPPTWPYVQPVDDATGQLLRVRNGLTSPRRLHGELSQDWDVIASETIEDNAYAIALAMKTADDVNSRKGDQQPVHWRELLSLPTPDGMQLTMPVATSQPPQQEPA